MAGTTDARRDTAREFAARFANEAFVDAADLLAETGREQVVESFSDEFRDGPMDAVDTLEAYWWGLYGQYGEFESVGSVSVGDEPVVELTFADGSERATVEVDDGHVTDFRFSPEYEPPAYADPNAFTERDVPVDGGDVDLGGVLAVPDGDGPFPGVVLVHGAGIHDPDGTAGNSKILKDFAWGLASAGVATLRYEKRLSAHDVDDENYTLDNVVVDDAVAAVGELAAVDEVDGDRVFVAGHSQGGMAAPRIADRRGDVAGVVVLDGPANPVMDPDDVAELRYHFEVDGDLDEQQEAQLEALRETVRRIANREYERDETIRGRPGVWHESVHDCDPVGAASELDSPVFAAKTGRADEELQAERFAACREDFVAWRDAELPAASRCEFYRGVGHYFQDGPTPATMDRLYFGGNVAEYVVNDVAEWVQTVADA